MRKIIVVTDPEIGWDGVLGAYVSLKQAVEAFGLEYVEGRSASAYEVPDRMIIFHETNFIVQGDI